MTSWRRLVVRVRELFRSSALDRDVTAEIQSHLDHLTDDYVRRGLNRDEARRRATLEFGAGGVEGAREAVRDTRGLPLIEQSAIDLRRAVRSLRRTPGFALTAGITLALGIGVSAAVFSMLDHVVLRPLPFPDADRLVSIWEARIRTDDNAAIAPAGSLLIGQDDPNRLAVAPASLVDYRARAAGFTGMAGHARRTVTLTGRGEPEALMNEVVTPGYFDVLGVPPAHGRAIVDADQAAGAPPVAIISDGLWQRHFGRDRAAIGATLTLNSRPHQIVGIMPPGFASVSQFMVVDPVAVWTTEHFPPELLANYGDHQLSVVARIAPGLALADAQRNLTRVAEDIARRSPKTNEWMRAFLRPLDEDLTRRVRTSLAVLTALVGFILLIACVNVANLFIVRSAAMRRDVAIRFALGASRRRIVTGMLAESLLLSVAAGAAGLVLAWWLKGLLISLAPTSVPRIASVSLDGRILLIGLGLSIATGLVFGLMPAWQARHAQPADAMSGGTRIVASRWMMRMRNGLLVVEVALSTVLVVGAGLMLRSLVTLNRVDLGFQTERVVAMAVSLPEQRYPNQDARLAFFEALGARVSSIPGVESVGFANRMPMRGSWESAISIDGPAGPGPMVAAGFQAVSPDFFRTLGIELRKGRLIGVADVKTSEPVAVVSETFARRLLPDADAIGRRFRRGPGQPWITVVGVVSDIRRDGKRASIDPQAFLAASQTSLYPVRLQDVAVRVSGDDGPIRTALRQAVTAVDPNQPVANIRTLDEVVSNAARDQRFQALLLGTFALLALVLAAVGVHGVVSYLVTQRTAEIGVRMALGAGTSAILWPLVTATGIRVIGGAVAGLAGAAALSRYISTLLFEVPATDLTTYGLAVLILVGVAIAAAGLAARRATRIDPVRALRAD